MIPVPLFDSGTGGTRPESRHFMNEPHALYYERTTALIQMLRTSTLTLGVFEKTTGVHIAHWRVLAFLSQHPDCTQKQLKDAHRVDPASITRTVKSLERDRLVVRRTDPKDNRLTRVILTAAGEKLVAEVSVRRRAYLRQALRGIAPADIEVFEKVLQQLDINALAMSKHKAPGKSRDAS
jgi:DNA-binding MarR family transcriptional regulator